MPTKKKTTKPTRVQLKNEIPTIITWLCTYIMVNSTAYTGYHEQKYKKWVGYKQILRGIWWTGKTSIYVHQFISTRESLNSLKFDSDIHFSTIYADIS